MLRINAVGNGQSGHEFKFPFQRLSATNAVNERSARHSTKRLWNPGRKFGCTIRLRRSRYCISHTESRVPQREERGRR